MCLWLFCVCVVPLSRFRRLSGVGVVLTSLAPDWFSGMVQKRGSWIHGKERAERILANAILIDGRKEWICKFCSESNVWTRWRCRRCYSDIPAGLRGKYKQAIAAKSGEWSRLHDVEREGRRTNQESGSREQGGDVERLSFISKEAQGSIKESVQHQLQEVEKRRHDLML